MCPIKPNIFSVCKLKLPILAETNGTPQSMAYMWHAYQDESIYVCE